MISVVIPIYNSRNTLNQCIQSILKQSYQDFELVLVNDGSTDDSLEICRFFENADNRVKVVDVCNGGVSKARNIGIKHATGDYLVFVDSDDYVTPDYLALLVENYHIERLTLCNFREVYPDKTEVKGVKVGRFYDLSEFMTLYDDKLINSPCNKLFELKLIKEKNIVFDHQYYLGEDLLFNLSYMREKNIKGFYLIEKPLYNYRIDNVVSLSKKFNPIEIDMQTILFKAVIAFIEDVVQNVELVNKAKESYYYALLFRLDGMYKNGRKKEACAKAKEVLLKNEITSLKEMLRISSNNKLKLKLLIACYMGFDVYYKLFGYK